MIINWRWNGLKENKFFESQTADDLLIITKYSNEKEDDFNNLISNFVKRKNPSELLVLTHNNPESSRFSIPANSIIELSSEVLMMKVKEFRGGEGSDEYIYYNRRTGIINTSKNHYMDQLMNDNFYDVWEYFWEKLDLENQKKKLINHWLPLAIDIQGLSEVYQEFVKTKKTDCEEKVKKYWIDIKDSVKGFKQLLSALDEIAEDFEELKVDGAERKKLNVFLDNLKTTEKDKLPVKYLDPKGDFFFPHWLESFAKKLDEKLKSQ